MGDDKKANVYINPNAPHWLKQIIDDALFDADINVLTDKEAQEELDRLQSTAKPEDDEINDEIPWP